MVMDDNTLMLNMMPVVGSGRNYIYPFFSLNIRKDCFSHVCIVITPVAVIIPPSNNIVMFIENVTSVKTKCVTLIYRRENRIVNNKIIL